MKTIQLTLVALTLMGASTITSAQTRQRTERAAATPTEMMQKRADRLAAELGLDDNAAAKFKEIYVRHNTNTDAAKAPAVKPQTPRSSAQTDGDIDAQIRKQLADRRAKAEAAETYYNELRTVLSARQAQKVMGQDNQQRAFRDVMPQPQKMQFPQRQGMQMPRQGMQMQQRQGMQFPQRQGMQMPLQGMQMQHHGMQIPQRQGMQMQHHQGMQIPQRSAVTPDQYSRPQLSEKEMKALKKKADKARKSAEKKAVKARKAAKKAKQAKVANK